MELDAYILECFAYDADQGGVVWNERPESHFATRRAFVLFNKKYKGQVAGGINSKGYRHVQVLGKNIQVHRIVYFLHHGTWPSVVDHVNRNPLDNRIENLRAASLTLNNANRVKSTAADPSVPKGVYRRYNRFIAQIKVNGQVTYLGSYATPEEASAAYRGAATAMFGEFAKHA